MKKRILSTLTLCILMTVAVAPLWSAGLGHDCCWDAGCPGNAVTQAIHNAETLQLRCLNTSAEFSPRMGSCEEWGYRNPSYISLECNLVACTFAGALKCPFPTGGYSFVSYTLECPAQGGQLPIAGGGFDRAQCIFPDGSRTTVVCAADGLHTEEMHQ